MRSLSPLLALAILLPACGSEEKPDEPLPGPVGELTLRSPAFRNGSAIPGRYTCAGEGISPPLAWSGVPRRTKELVLLMEDPDADRFVHWTVLAISPTLKRLTQGRVPRGAVETENSFGKRGWGPPCPPKGDEPHRYVFALYATSVRLGLGPDSAPDEVRQGLADRSLARGTLTGRFGRR